MPYDDLKRPRTIPMVNYGVPEYDVELMQPRYSIPQLGNYSTPNPEPKMAYVPHPSLTTPPVTGGSGSGLGGIPVVSGALNLGLGIKQLFDANHVKLNDTVPEELKNMGGDARLRAATARLPNYNQAMANINRNATIATNSAAAGATSSDQVLQAAGDIQSRSNAAIQNLEGAGAQFQQGNIDKSRQIEGQIGEIKRQDKANKALKEAMLTESGWRNIGNFAAAADTLFL